MSKGLNKLKLRLDYIGGTTSQDRMIEGKSRSFQSALQSSYQKAMIMKLSDGEYYNCLINPDINKPDYDNKIISIELDAGMQPGDTFFWVANNTYWLIYLKELTEIAYFRGSIRRCHYKFTINGNDYYSYVRGPTETNIQWAQKAGISWNTPNYSLNIYLPKTEESLEYFQRFNVISIDDNNWKVDAVDSISTPGILEVSLSEFFNNQYEDLQNIIVAEEINTSVPHIAGSQIVKPYDIKTYSAVLISGGVWSLDNDNARIVSSTDMEAIIEVVSGKSGEFVLTYTTPSDGNLTLTIHIDSL